MSRKDLAELTAESTVLTADVCVYMMLGRTLESLKFVAEKRCLIEEDAISRFGGIRSGNWNCN